MPSSTLSNEQSFQACRFYHLSKNSLTTLKSIVCRFHECNNKLNLEILSNINMCRCCYYFIDFISYISEECIVQENFVAFLGVNCGFNAGNIFRLPISSWSS